MRPAPRPPSRAIPERRFSARRPKGSSPDLVAFGVDRFRDIVRRALLARIALGSGADPKWPIGDDQGVDAALTDDDDERDRPFDSLYATRTRRSVGWRGSSAAISASDESGEASK